MGNFNNEIKVLIIHGPNMNLLGLRTKQNKSKITLDKLNNFLKKEAKKRNIKLKLIQTNDESKAVTVLQRMRNKIKGIILYPGPWRASGHVLKDTLTLLSIPYITISFEKESTSILNSKKNLYDGDIFKITALAFSKLEKKLL